MMLIYLIILCTFGLSVPLHAFAINPMMRHACLCVCKATFQLRFAFFVVCRLLAEQCCRIIWKIEGTHPKLQGGPSRPND